MEKKICKILLVEDDKALSFIIQDNLKQNNFDVDIAEDGENALKIFSPDLHSIVILDVMLPKRDGFSVATEIRKTDLDTPILFLTARSLTEDKILGLKIGGDDYITKPFSMEELLLKINIFLKRSKINNNNNTIEASNDINIGSYIFSYKDLSLTFDKKNRRLTLKEAELIKLFSKNRNNVLSRSDILKCIWGSDDYFLGRSLDVFISRLRKYFKNDPNISIINLHGIGFRFLVKDNNLST